MGSHNPVPGTTRLTLPKEMTLLLVLHTAKPS